LSHGHQAAAPAGHAAQIAQVKGGDEMEGTPQTYGCYGNTGVTMDTEKALERIDWIIASLKNLDAAFQNDDRQVMSLELQTIRVELNNLRQIIRASKDKDS
jgi:hypothetical protein